MYSEIVMDHFQNPRNAGELTDADAVGKAGEVGRGNYVVIYLRLEGGCIAQTGFLTYGCAPAIAAASVLTEMIQGDRPEGARQISAETLQKALGGLPLGRRHCAAQAIEALREAIDRIEQPSDNR